ncbi:MAG: hypothetical protein ACO1OF_00550 [Adhaeribacter sp.]
MKKKHRYPGVRPFETSDSSLFFGRDRDCSNLLGLIALEKLVVLFSKSGYGKTSLINAALIPALELEGCMAFPVRFGISTSSQEPLSKHLLTSIENYSSIRPNPEMTFLDAVCPEKTLWYEVKRRQRKNCRWVFFFDQFEEYFQQPAGLRRNFEEQVAELLYSDVPQTVLNNSDGLDDHKMALLVQPQDIRVVFSIRADRLSELEGLKKRLPAILHKRFELAALTREQARDGIEKPAALIDTDFISPPFEYKPEALNEMLDGLAGPKGGIEAFQLQILCDYIDNKVTEGRVPDRDNNGRPDVDIVDLPDAEKVFGEYYARRLNTLPDKSKAAARHIIEEELIFENEQTGEARRVSLDKDLLLRKAAINGATEELLLELGNTFLLRREFNSLGGFNYEISHDTLLAPVLKAKRERLMAERGAAAEQMREAALERAQKAEADAKYESARRRRATIQAVVAFIFFLLATAFGGYAFHLKNQASKEKEKAEQAKIEAEESLRLMRKAETKRIKAEEEKGAVEVKLARTTAHDIMKRAKSLRSEYPESYEEMKKDAQNILQEMQQKYPTDTSLSNDLKKLND